MASNLMETVEEKLLPVAAKISGNKVLIAIRDGITLALPLIIVGSLFMVVGNFPIEAWTKLLTDSGAINYLNKITNGSFNIMALIAAFGVARSYAKQFKVDDVSAGVISLAAFLILTPSIFSGDKTPLEGWALSYMGSKGLFVAIIEGVLSARIFAWFIQKDIRIKMPEAVPPAVADSFSALIPAAAILTLWGAVYAICDVAGISNIHDVLMIVLGGPLSLLGATLPGTIIVVGLNSLFWFLGIHGGNIVNPIFQPIWLMNAQENLTAFQAGQSLPHIVTQPFMDNFVYMGGGGATLGLVIVIALVAARANSSKITKTIAPLTLTPGIFNINEPAMFGLPIVMNVSLLIPFVLVPMVNVEICYTAMATGIVPHTTGVIVSWTMPPIISGFLTTNSIMGSVLQAVCIVIDALFYLPFFLTVEKQNKAEEAGESLEELASE